MICVSGGACRSGPMAVIWQPGMGLPEAGCRGRAGCRAGAAAAVTLRAALPGLTALTAAERALLGDWLDRVAESQRVPRG
jgi:hypothetical protein